MNHDQGSSEGEGEVAFFSAKLWDRRNRANMIESATPCHDAQVVGSCRVSNPLRLTVVASKSEDYTTSPQHLRTEFQQSFSSNSASIEGILAKFAGILVSQMI